MEDIEADEEAFRAMTPGGLRSLQLLKGWYASDFDLSDLNYVHQLENRTNCISS